MTGYSAPRRFNLHAPLILFFWRFHRKPSGRLSPPRKLFLACDGARLPAQSVARHVHGNSQQPGSQQFFAGCGVHVAIEPEKDLLRHVFGESGITHQRTRSAEDGAVMQREGFVEAERLRVCLNRPGH